MAEVVEKVFGGGVFLCPLIEGADSVPVVGPSFDRVWRRRQTTDGAVEYNGFPIQQGVPWKAIGTARFEDDLLCEVWPGAIGPLELCTVIFRVPDGEARGRWGDYVMVTDQVRKLTLPTE